MDRKIAIQADDLVFSYDKKINIINKLSLSLYQGETTVLTGANGSGKTTLGKLLLKIFKPSMGIIHIFEKNIESIPLSHIGQKIGYCFQNPGQQLFTSSVEEEISFGLKYRGESADFIHEVTESMLNLFEIKHLRSEFPLNLSWGEKRRVVLAAALALNPQYLILDEPTMGLDDGRINILNRVLDNLRNKGIGMLLISHNQQFIEENANRILLMNRGNVENEFCK
ncbi:MAG: ABC transporter ATP-binding protein [Clostridia bacterium]